MNNTYENINTFSDDIYKSDLREKILNPLIVQHNSMGLDLYNNHARIKALEEGGVGGGVAKFKDLEDVPAYEANKFLKVNTAGDLEWGAISAGENGGAVDDSRITAAEEDIIALQELTTEQAATLVTQKAKIDDNTARIIDLENNSGSGSGEGAGGGSYDDTALVAAVDAVEADVVKIKTDVTKAKSDITTLKAESADYENRIAAIEVTGGNGTVDLSPVTDRLDVIEVDLEAAVSELATASDNIITIQGEVTDHETRIADLESSGSGSGSAAVAIARMGFGFAGSRDDGADAATVAVCSVVNVQEGANTITLPGISKTPAANQVGHGFVRFITAEAAATINTTGSDEIWKADGTNNATSMSLPAGQTVVLISYAGDGWGGWQKLMTCGVHS